MYINNHENKSVNFLITQYDNYILLKEVKDNIGKKELAQLVLTRTIVSSFIWCYAEVL